MNIHLTPEQEQIVNDEVRSGHFRTAEEVITGALRVLREQDQSPAATGANGDSAEAVRQMLSFIEKNSVRLEGVTVKELIHEGHRL